MAQSKAGKTDLVVTCLVMQALHGKHAHFFTYLMGQPPLTEGKEEKEGKERKEGRESKG